VGDPFTPEDIEKLSAAIDADLRELGAPGTALNRGRTAREALGEKQRRAIEAATGEEATSFLARFKAAARKDLCEKGGVLHTQWAKWKDLANKPLRPPARALGHRAVVRRRNTAGGRERLWR